MFENHNYVNIIDSRINLDFVTRENSYSRLEDKAIQCVVAVQLQSCVQHFVIPWTAALQAPLSSTVSWSLLKFMSVELVMPSNHLIICRPLLLPSVFPSTHIFFWIDSSPQVAKVLELQHQSFQWIFRVDFL